MIKSGVATTVIIAKIKSSPSKFDTTPAALTELKAAGVADEIVLAMVESSNRPADATRSASVPVTESVVKVPDGTEIEIQLKNTLSGQEVKVGDIVDFTIVRDVQINGITVFERDALARARVTTAKRLVAGAKRASLSGLCKMFKRLTVIACRRDSQKDT